MLANIAFDTGTSIVTPARWFLMCCEQNSRKVSHWKNATSPWIY